jgi:hypothetical protein
VQELKPKQRSCQQFLRRLGFRQKEGSTREQVGVFFLTKPQAKSRTIVSVMEIKLSSLISVDIFTRPAIFLAVKET